MHFSVLSAAYFFSSCSKSNLKDSRSIIREVVRDVTTNTGIEKETKTSEEFNNTLYSLKDVKINLENFSSNEPVPKIRVYNLSHGSVLNLYESRTGCDSGIISSLKEDGLFEGIEESRTYQERFFYVELCI